MAGITVSPQATEAKALSPWKIDVWLTLSVVLLIAIGMMSLFSVSQARTEDYFAKQFRWLVVGAVPFLIFFLVHPMVWRRAATIIYIVNVVMLAGVLVVGVEMNGATRWVEIAGVRFQPSEMAKILTVLTLAAFFSTRLDSIHKFSTFVLSLLHVLPPLLLIFKEPHLGGAILIVVAWLSVCIGAGVPLKFIGGSILAAATLLYLMVAFSLLTPYQMSRVFGMSEGDEKGKGFQVVRAEIAFGVGGVQGTGFLNGEEKRGGFIPEQQTDFIFTVIGEEGGLIGCAMVLAAFGFFFYRAWLVMFRASEPFYKMAAAGVLGVLAFHAIANMGMTLKLLPVVGLWLPFMSYGGTALWMCMSAVALLLNIKRHERPVLF